MKANLVLVYELLYMDDTTEKIVCVDFIYATEGFLIFSLPNFTKRYIKASAIANMTQCFEHA